MPSIITEIRNKKKHNEDNRIINIGLLSIADEDEFGPVIDGEIHSSVSYDDITEDYFDQFADPVNESEAKFPSAKYPLQRGYSLETVEGNYAENQQMAPWTTLSLDEDGAIFCI